MELRIDGELLFILFGSNTAVSALQHTYPMPGSSNGVRIIWSGGPMAYKDILAETVVPEIEEPDFESFTHRIVDALANFRMVGIYD